MGLYAHNGGQEEHLSLQSKQSPVLGKVCRPGHMESFPGEFSVTIDGKGLLCLSGCPLNGQNFRDAQDLAVLWLLVSSTDWMRLTYMMEGVLLYLTPTDYKY